MEDGFDEGGGHADGAGELAAGKGAAVLPEEAGDLEAFGLGELADGPVEEAVGLFVGFGAQLAVAAHFQEGAGALDILFRDVLLADEQEGEVALGGAEEGMDSIQVDVAAGEDHAALIHLPGFGNLLPRVEQGPPLVKGHVLDAAGSDGRVFQEKDPAYAPGVLLGKIRETGVHRIPEDVDDLALQFQVVGKRVRHDDDAFLQEIGPTGLLEVTGEEALELVLEALDVLRIALPDQMEVGIHDDVAVHADLILEGQYGNQVAGEDHVLRVFEQHGRPCSVRVNVVAVLHRMTFPLHVILHDHIVFVQIWGIVL